MAFIRVAWLVLIASGSFGSDLSGSDGLSDRDGSGHCPSDNYTLPEGSSKIVAPNIANHPRIVRLLKENESSAAWDHILCITERRMSCYNNIKYEGYFYLSQNSLAVANANDMLTGCYRMINYLSSSCVHQFCLKILGPYHCPSDNFSIVEGSSKIIPLDISSSSNMLAFFKKHGSSARKHIWSIRDGKLMNATEEKYQGHFLIQEGGLTVNNVNEEVTGEYQLVDGKNESCIKQFSINMQGSKGTNNLLFLVFVIIILLVAVVAVRLCKRKRKRGDGNQDFEMAPACENGSPVNLLNGIKIDGHGHVAETTESPLRGTEE